MRANFIVFSFVVVTLLGGNCATAVGPHGAARCCTTCPPARVNVHIHAKEKARGKCKYWHGVEPPRAAVVESVPVMRVTPPLLRTELVVSREAMRVVPVASGAELRAVREVEMRRLPETKAKETTCPAETESARKKKEAEQDRPLARDSRETLEDTPQAKIERLEEGFVDLSRRVDKVIEVLDRQQGILERYLLQQNP